jgi:hypothetical protein
MRLSKISSRKSDDHLLGFDCQIHYAPVNSAVGFLPQWRVRPDKSEARVINCPKQVLY